MSYTPPLTKEQKAAIAPMLKELKRIEKLEESSDKISSQMELTSILFHGNVPKVSRKPQLSDYGLPDDVKMKIEYEKQQIANKLKKRTKTIRLVLLIVCAVSILFELLLLTEGRVAAVMLSLAVLLFGQLGISMSYDNKDAKLKETKVKYEDDYDRFLDDQRAYLYWEAMKRYSYWNSLDGHSFERAVAALYRAQGYEAEVSKEGGDGGIDLLLRKDGEETIVQCKAHNKAVAPAVARDLYGTMIANHYSKGIIISKNGFTKGVYDFVKDKDIELVDLDMILQMQLPT